MLLRLIGKWLNAGVLEEGKLFYPDAGTPQGGTAASRFRRKLCARHRHEPVAQQHAILTAKLRGHCAYFGITGNAEALNRFCYEVRGTWGKWLRRRGQRRRSWESIYALLARFPLPGAEPIHSTLRRRVAKP